MPRVQDDFKDVLAHYRSPFSDPNRPPDHEALKKWLCKILIWGHAKAGLSNHLKLLEEEYLDTYDKPLLALLHIISQRNPDPDIGNTVRVLKEAKLPQFGRVVFGSKLLMMARPDLFVVLDGNIWAKLKSEQRPREMFCGQMSKEFLELCKISRESRKSLEEFTGSVSDAYIRWCKLCGQQAKEWSRDETWLPSDVERYFFSHSAKVRS